MVNTALKLEHALPESNAESDTSPLKIIGESKEINSLKEQIIKLARSQAPVFISGESGSGKEQLQDLSIHRVHAGKTTSLRLTVAQYLPS